MSPRQEFALEPPALTRAPKTDRRDILAERDGANCHYCGVRLVVPSTIREQCDWRPGQRWVNWPIDRWNDLVRAGLVEGPMPDEFLRVALCFCGSCGPEDACTFPPGWEPRGGAHWATVDHVIPTSRDGADHLGNLVLACSSCNESKGARTPSEWLGAWL